MLLLEQPGSTDEFHSVWYQLRIFRHLDGHLRSNTERPVDYFYRRQNDFWMKEIHEELPALKRSTNMLICGEDLGDGTSLVA